MFYVYILYSDKLGMFYKGHTNDVTARLEKHNRGQNVFTAKGTPWTLLWCIEKPTKAEAYRLELKLKNLSKERTIRFVLKFKEGIVGSDELLRVQQFSEC